jgi:phytanoyl-CoA hydroxylase
MTGFPAGFKNSCILGGVAVLQAQSTMLTQDQISHYHHQGYVVLTHAIPKQPIEQLKAAALEIVDHFDIDKHRTVFKTSDRDAGRDDYFFNSAENIHCFLEEHALDEDGTLLKPARLAINKIGHAMHDLHPAFRSFCQQPLLGQLIRDIGFQNPLLWQSMYIFKQPRIGGEVRWHQDASYLISEPASVTGIWIAIEDANRDNGCLWVQPGGHRSPLREIYLVDWVKREGTLKRLDTTPWPDKEDAVALEVPYGSVVIFHDHMPHYSSQNFSQHSRHAFSLHVAEKTSRWSEMNWLQRPALGDFKL